ncbi:DNA methyltransferase 1-associated protein 1 [Halotydeus destructor]|nr:DNA methyltransferase 1-associated protein 1 [Halotydeus destructor]
MVASLHCLPLVAAFELFKMSADAKDILDIDRTPSASEATRDGATVGSEKLSAGSQRQKKMKTKIFKRPEGMSRELYNLFLSDSKDPTAPVVPSDMMPGLNKIGGYKQLKAKFGSKKVRPWRWMPFVNPGRSDGFKLHHWRRIADENKEYPFAKFAVAVNIASYTESEYQQHLETEDWTKAETDYLFDMCRRFDLRFMLICDRWDKQAFPVSRSVEELKDRYYGIVNTLTKVKSVTGQDLKLKVYDAEHEKKRKEQLIKQYNRTSEQIEEEQKLLEELRKIEARKREREKKTQDLQKLITAADNTASVRKSETPVLGRPGRGPGRKKLVPRTSAKDAGSAPSTADILESAGIKFPENKSSGTMLRSTKMKLPASVGQKKAKAIETLLQELNVEVRPMPTEEISTHFNDLRSDMVLLYELKMALANCEFELQTLKHQVEALKPVPTDVKSSTVTDSKAVSTPKVEPSIEPLPTVPVDSIGPKTPPIASVTTDSKKGISEVIDVTVGPGTPNRKRKAAIEQEKLLKKLKKSAI